MANTGTGTGSGTFRTALNGFNREDVAAYLEKAAERYNALKEDKIQLKKQVAELETRLSEQENTQSRSQEQEAQLSEQSRTIAALQAEVEELRSENTELLLRLKEAESKAYENADKVTEYDTLRQRIATLELEASRRAVEIERSAETHAMELRQAAHDEEAVFNQRKEAATKAYQQSLTNVALSANLTAKLLGNEMSHMIEALREIAASLEETAGTLEPASYAPPADAAAPEGAE